MFEKESKMSILDRINFNSIQLMKTKAIQKLNPYRYQLSKVAKQRIRWLYVAYYETNNNVTMAASKIGISREWLSKIKSKFENSQRDPRSLEPESTAPFNINKRQRISKEIEEKILEVRNKHPYLGEKKISRVLERDYQIKVSSPTINRYLHKHQKISPTISDRIKKAWSEKKEREKSKEINLKVKYRPPRQIKDLLPGALVEKDMKLVPKINGFGQKQGVGGYKIKDYFYFQQTFIDSFTRIRGLGLTEESTSRTAKECYQRIKNRLPFPVACFNTDNGGENGKDFSEKLNQDNVVHFYSRSSTPTDNPRVERSHLTDEKEFYQRQNIYSSFKEQQQALKKWEHTYNYYRPHQALGYLTPMEFYHLWEKDPAKAFQITEKWQNYLRRERTRLANSRRLKRKEQIEKLMQFIEAKLTKKVELNTYKLDLVKCELCS